MLGHDDRLEKKDTPFPCKMLENECESLKFFHASNWIIYCVSAFVKYTQKKSMLIQKEKREKEKSWREMRRWDESKETASGKVQHTTLNCPAVRTTTKETRLVYIARARTGTNKNNTDAAWNRFAEE